MPTEEEIIENLRKCPYFDRCSQNLCPLDLELLLRTGNKQDKCRWMRESKKVKIRDKEIYIRWDSYARRPLEICA
jgi:hypothetical protein